MKGRQRSAKARASSRDNFSMNLQSRGNLFYEGGGSLDGDCCDHKPKYIKNEQKANIEKEQRNKVHINLLNLKYRNQSPGGQSELPNKNVFK